MFHFLGTACFSVSFSLSLSPSHSFLLGLSSLFPRRRRSLLYAPRPDSRFVFESTSCRARMKEEKKGTKERKRATCRCVRVGLYLWLVREQPGHARGSCPKVQKIMPDCRRVCVCICVFHACMRLRNFLFRVHRMYDLSYPSSVSENFHSLLFIFFLIANTCSP